MSDAVDVGPDEPTDESHDLTDEAGRENSEGAGSLGDEAAATSDVAAGSAISRADLADVAARLSNLYDTSAIGRQMAEALKGNFWGRDLVSPRPFPVVTFGDTALGETVRGIQSSISKMVASQINPVVSEQFNTVLSNTLKGFSVNFSHALPGFQPLAGISAFLGQWAERVREQTADLGRTLTRGLLPPNLRDIDGVRIRDVLDLAESEAISLYLVPRTSIAKAILNGKDREARRNVLNRRFYDILDDCDDLLDRCVAPGTRAVVPFARDAIRAARDGHHSAAQALAANVLDSTLRLSFDKKTRARLTSHKETPTARDLEISIRQAWVFISVWRVHETFHTHMGDPIPSAFSRHASAHAVSRRQFSKRNTAQGIMVLTSLIGFLNGL